MILFHIAMATLAGLASHQLKRLTDRLPEGISQIANYTIGSFVALPFVAVIHRDLKSVRGASTRLAIAYLLAFFGVGAGTVLGWLGWAGLICPGCKMSKRHSSPLSNTLPGLLIESGRWALALFMGLAALAWLMIAGMRDE